MIDSRLVNESKTLEGKGKLLLVGAFIYVWKMEFDQSLSGEDDLVINLQ